MTVDLSPAERYAASRRKTPLLDAFRAKQRFDLDPFQLEACASVEAGNSVLVAAPTGAGKTIIAEFAIYAAMQRTRSKVFYTAPMKALSNQKFNELVAEYGAESVGLLTGDTNINARARIVVMTTEVLRNMLYADSERTRSKVFYTAPMKALSNQKFNELVAEYGAESVGLLTGDTNINARARIVVMTTEVLRNMLYADSDLLADLAYVIMDEVHYLADRFRGAVWEEVIIHLPQEVRMVSLSATVSNAEEFGDWLQAVRGHTEVIVSEERPVPLDQHVLMRGKLIDLFAAPSLAETNSVNPELVRMAQFGGRSPNSKQYNDVSRYNAKRGQRTQQRVDRAQVVELLDEHHLLPAIFFIFSRVGCDQAVTQVLRSGIRLTEAHERDEIRQIVEERCSALQDEDLAVLGYWEWLEGLERGIAAHHAGMLPAFKEVVEELFRRKLVKAVFATETLALGINMPARTVVLEKLEKFNGEARVPITPGEYTQLTGRAGRRGIDVEGHAVIAWQEGLHPQSVASLASRRSYPLNSSFKPTYNMAANLIDQFGRERTREILESSFAQFQADRAVVGMARKVREQENSLAKYREAMTCHLGDFAEYASIRRELTDLERKSASPERSSRSQNDRRQRQLVALRKRMRAHPCHGCAEREQHARWAERWFTLKRQTDQLSRQISTRTGAVAKIFDRVTDVLLEYEYLIPAEGGEVELSAAGRTLKRIYGERDLLVAEALRRGVWNDLDPASLAAMASCIVFEPRRDEGTVADRYLPGGAFRVALDRTQDLWARLDDTEQENRLPGSEPLATGLCVAMHKWARGSSLNVVLTEADMAAGDFVRWTKQTIDLLDQLSIVADGGVGRNARKALEAIRRGIVAYSTV